MSSRSPRSSGSGPPPGHWTPPWIRGSTSGPPARSWTRCGAPSRGGRDDPATPPDLDRRTSGIRSPSRESTPATASEQLIIALVIDEVEEHDVPSEDRVERPMEESEVDAIQVWHFIGLREVPRN